MGSVFLGRTDQNTLSTFGPYTENSRLAVPQSWLGKTGPHKVSRVRCRCPPRLWLVGRTEKMSFRTPNGNSAFGVRLLPAARRGCRGLPRRRVRRIIERFPVDFVRMPGKSTHRWPSLSWQISMVTFFVLPDHQPCSFNLECSATAVL